MQSRSPRLSRPFGPSSTKPRSIRVRVGIHMDPSPETSGFSDYQPLTPARRASRPRMAEQLYQPVSEPIATRSSSLWVHDECPLDILQGRTADDHKEPSVLWRPRSPLRPSAYRSHPTCSVGLQLLPRRCTGRALPTSPVPC